MLTLSFFYPSDQWKFLRQPGVYTTGAFEYAIQYVLSSRRGGIMVFKTLICGVKMYGNRCERIHEYYLLVAIVYITSSKGFAVRIGASYPRPPTLRDIDRSKLANCLD